MTYSRAAAMTVQAGISLLITVFSAAVFIDIYSYMFQEQPTFSVMFIFVFLFGFFIIFYNVTSYFFPKLLRNMESLVESSHDALVASAEALSPRALGFRIIIVAAASLFIELIFIRWQANLFPVFALYKNYTLLACFCGLGIGYAKADQRLTLPAALPVMTVSLGALCFIRYGANPDFQQILFVVPVQEEVFVGAAANYKSAISTIIYNIPVYGLLISTFLLNAFALIPIGQYCGFLMNRTKALSAYSFNLIGSIAGVALLFFLSAQWAAPVIWFSIGTALIYWLQISVSNARTVGLVSAIFCVLLTAWPFTPLSNIIYSPYQMIEVASKRDGYAMLLAASTYYQKIYNLSPQQAEHSAFPDIKQIVGHYELPFRSASSLEHVAVIGAGTGNDVAAALRTGAQSVDAVEIDPAIYRLGVIYHPEHPYRSPRVNAIIDDARTFFRDSTKSYDAIVYGVLDSHILLSHGSSVRLDSFVYTEEGLREAYNHLKPQGILSVSFALQSPLMGQKIFEIFDGFPKAGTPIAIVSGYDAKGTTLFMVKKNGEISLPDDFIKDHTLKDVTPWYKQHNAEARDLPSDDWPFFYMDRHSFPSTYVVSLVIILLLSALLMRNFLPQQKPQLRLAPFFFLGSGFMLVETKAITELGLLFGNTWQVIGIAIIGVLVMAFFANWLCLRWPLKATNWAWVMLLAVIGLGYAMAAHIIDINITGTDFDIGKVLLLICPLFFSGILFSTLLRNARDTSGAMAHNLAGAMLGGALEYNAMEFGFASLYLIALLLYLLAWVSSAMQVKLTSCTS